MSFLGDVIGGVEDIATGGITSVTGGPGSTLPSLGSLIGPSGPGGSLSPLLAGGGLALATGNPIFASLGAGAATAFQAAQNAASANAANAQIAAGQESFSGDQAALNRSFQQDSADTQMQFQDSELAKSQDFSAAEQSLQYREDTASVQQQEEFQEQMSNTAYQRATADMKAAGINPMLAYMQGGASTPTGSSVSVSAPTSPVPGGSSASGAQASPSGYTYQTIPGTIGAGLSSAMSLINSFADYKLADAQAVKAGADTALTEARTPFAAAEGRVFTWVNNLLDKVSSTAKQIYSGPLQVDRSAADNSNFDFANQVPMSQVAY